MCVQRPPHTIVEMTSIMVSKDYSIYLKPTLIFFSSFLLAKNLDYFFTGYPKSALREGKNKFKFFFIGALQQKGGKSQKVLVAWRSQGFQKSKK